MTYASESNARGEYLATQVLTATPQKLRLMLVDAALRHCLRARDDFAAGEFIAGGEPIIKAQEILTEIITAVRAGADENPLGNRIVSLYTFLFRQLVAAHLHHERAKLDDAIRVLDIERETWLAVCDKLGAHAAHDGVPAPNMNSRFSLQA